MRKERIQVILLCEDKQQKSFVYILLKKKGLKIGNLRVNHTPLGTGSGEKYVRKLFTQELKYYRSRRANAVFITMIDGDTIGINGRIQQLQQECEREQIAFRRENEAVMIAVPTRNIETWIHFQNGNEVDELTSYPKLDKPSDCQSAVDKLVEMCNNKEPIIGCPSLDAACQEYRLVL